MNTVPRGVDPQVFGRYEIRRKLAGGGMGRVYLAYDPNLNRDIGLKLIDLGTDSESLEVIAAEHRGAKLQALLAECESGGRVAKILEVGELDGYFYIAMEYVEGQDLSELISRGPMEPARAVAFALDVLDVLTRAHTLEAVIDERQHRGIIHGDIKPRNIRITPQGKLKLLDFGIAKAVSMSRSLTFNQFGSVPYSSPERLRTGDMDVRSDVWSVGIVLFEMLAGRAYFKAQSAERLEWIIRNYSAVQPMENIPPGLCEVLTQALHPDPRNRFESAAEMCVALVGWQATGAYVRPNRSPVESGTINAPSGDMEKTRRTMPGATGGGFELDEATRRADPFPPDEVTRRPDAASRPSSQPYPAANRPTPAVPRPALVSTPAAKRARAIAIIIGLVVFLLGVVWTVSVIRSWSKASNLRRRIESGQLSANQGSAEYQALAKSSWLSWPLYPARAGLAEKFSSEANQVITDYREASESTPVSTKDWKRAQAAIASAATLAPDDTTIRARASLIEGHLKLRASDLKGARSGFEAARDKMPKAPDPHLGLAMIHMQDSDLDKAEAELNEAQRNGFRPGRREQKFLADAYRKRGERWISVGRKAHDISRMEDAFRKADGDLEHAQNLYNSVAPFFDGIELSERVAAQREQVKKSLSAAQLAQPEKH